MQHPDAGCRKSREFCSASVAFRLHPGIDLAGITNAISGSTFGGNKLMTKNVVLGAIAALVLGTAAAVAADLPMKTKAPPPIAIYDWTGFYIGVSGGGSLGQSTHIDQATGLGDTIGYNVKGGLVGGT